MHQLVRSLLSIAAICVALVPSVQAQLPSPVQFAVRVEAGDIRQVNQWLEAGLPTDFLADRIGTGLMIAAWEGNIPMMEAFVTRGADVNKLNAAGEQALLHAAWRGNLEAVKWLLGHGAKINREPLQWTALHYAVFAGHSQLAQYLLERGADINARSTNGSSVLMMAAYEGHEALAQQLIGLGADPGVKNENGDGALEWAMKHQHLRIARIVSDPRQFATAAGWPKAHWSDSIRSLPAVSPQAALADKEIERLLSVRSLLASRGMSKAVDQLDRQIAALRAKPELDRRPAAILEISARRSRPGEQQARLITEHASRKRP